MLFQTVVFLAVVLITGVVWVAVLPRFDRRPSPYPVPGSLVKDSRGSRF